MNWRLKFTKSEIFVELLAKGGKIILIRPFRGWVYRPYEDTHIQPKFDLEKGETVYQDKETGDLVYKKS